MGEEGARQTLTSDAAREQTQPCRSRNQTVRGEPLTAAAQRLNSTKAFQATRETRAPDRQR